MIGSVGLFFYFKNEKFKRFVKEKFLGFYQGTKSIWTMKKKWAFIAHTFFIWGAYIGALWLFALSFPQRLELELIPFLAFSSFQRLPLVFCLVELAHILFGSQKFWHWMVSILPPWESSLGVHKRSQLSRSDFFLCF